MRTTNLPQVGQALYVTDKDEVVRVATERPSWVTDKLCVVRVEDNKVSWIDQDKLISKEEWDIEQREKKDHEQEREQG